MKLKPCPVPWCDREQAPALIVNSRYDNSRSYRVVCLRCNCSTDFFDTKEEAAAQWNTRADEPKTELRCVITKNICGTDTWVDRYPCPCENCKKYVADTNSRAADAASCATLGSNRSSF